MTTRREHRQSLLRDPDALHGLAVSTLLLVLSGGLLYLFYLWRVWRVAVAAPVDIEPGAPTWLLLFGKRCEDGCPDADFRMRIDRAAVLADDHPDWRLVLRECAAAGTACCLAGVPVGAVVEAVRGQVRIPGLSG